MSILQALADQAIFLSLISLLGLVIGSFLNVVIHRLPLMLEREWAQQCAEMSGVEIVGPPVRFNLAVPRSRCPHCGHEITALENIPVLSYLFLRGRCRGCGSRISVRYPLIELAAGALAFGVAWRFGVSAQALAACVFCWVLLALTFIDFDTQLLPDDLTLPLLWIGLLINTMGVMTDLQSAVWGAAAGYLSLWSVYWAFKLLTGKEGMGYGDFKLLAAIGAWLGWQVLPVVILFSSLVGAVVGLTLLLKTDHHRSKPMPFGPYLAAAGVLSLFWGKELIAWYLA